jgi:hypothetical protein
MVEEGKEYELVMDGKEKECELAEEAEEEEKETEGVGQKEVEEKKEEELSWVLETKIQHSHLFLLP